ncbi:hypothetical protein NQ318_002699 [Aromia moschata]|uniref:Uncharacterized protein n=1 Tax=Aromia moschata TaxID=1265417 RepID=A0AAV8Y366_9CUCU|nr:hypothetical protein NQ318_002699 [Aromia moschata]
MDFKGCQRSFPFIQRVNICSRFSDIFAYTKGNYRSGTVRRIWGMGDVRIADDKVQAGLGTPDFISEECHRNAGLK